MRCYRCHGRMNYETFFTREGVFSGWRCIHCGEIFDELVFENRKRSRFRKSRG